MQQRIFYLIAAAGFASMASMRICDALLPDLAESFQVSTGTAASSISMFVIAYGLLQLIYGPLGDRYGKLRVITGAVIASTFINLALAFSASMASMAAMRGIAGALTAGIIPLSMAHIGDSTPYSERQHVLAKFLTATILGMMSGQWVGGFLADFLNWQAAFIVLTAVYGGVAILLIRARPNQADSDIQRPSFLTQVHSVLRISWARRVLVVALFEGALVFSSLVFVPAYLHERFGLPLTAAGAIVALYGIGGLLYAFFARTLLSHLGEKGLAMAGGALLAAGYGILAFGGHWLWAMPACLIAGLGFYMLHNTLQVNATQMAPHARGTSVSLFACSLFLGQSVGIAAVAVLMGHLGINAAFIVSMSTLPLLGLWFAHSIQGRSR